MRVPDAEGAKVTQKTQKNSQKKVGVRFFAVRAFSAQLASNTFFQGLSCDLCVFFASSASGCPLPLQG